MSTVLTMSRMDKYLRYILILVVLLPVVIHQYTTHPKIGNNRRMFFGKLPEHEIACIPQTEVARAMQAFADVAALADLAPSLVFLLLRRPDFAEVQLDVGRELQRWTVE